MTFRSVLASTTSDPVSDSSIGSSSLCVVAVLTRTVPSGTFAPTLTGTVIVTCAPGASDAMSHAIVWPDGARLAEAVE